MRALLTHLLPAARELALCDDGVRIKGLARSHWIDYPRATQALEILERLLQTPQRERMPCLLLHGDSNIGKTQIVSKFQRRHPPEYDEEKGVELRSIVAMQMPPTPEQPRFYSSLLFELGAPFNAAARLSALENLSRALLRKVSARMLIVDEVHHLLAGNYREQRASLNLMKFLANDLKIAVVLVGTQDAVMALQTDPQMVSRFARLEVPRWQETEAFRSLLAAFEMVLPLRRPSNLARREMVHAILTASGGLTGEVSRVLTVSAELAIRDGQEAIDLGHIENAARTLVS
ncbi:TniB family NTP-binding protein [Cupriavidus sp. D39]|uniref:TniB family NTP-binding protein n=1 Tax=Cupriavidus sp. D39 TaxID=2997877 RepID=UPI00226D9987|nr:TniB family NTP-binding protein [Cupriavidus sp. D39]MCY0853459.1 TniB family NTP-binding protein [Cupriavidus sp. D39]